MNIVIRSVIASTALTAGHLVAADDAPVACATAAVVPAAAASVIVAAPAAVVPAAAASAAVQPVTVGLVAPPVASQPTPLGTWHWFMGPDITFRDDHIFYDRNRYGTWKWTDEAKHELRLDWVSIPFVDQLTLSEDGNHLKGQNNVNDAVSGFRVASPPPASLASADLTSPVGVWQWFAGRDVTVHSDQTVSSLGQAGSWQWIDKSKRLFRIDWKTLPFVDTLTVSEDGTHLTGQNDADGIPNGTAGTRVASPLGKWQMNSGNNISFSEDHTVTFPGHRGFWYWTDEATYAFKIEWETMAYVDMLTVSADGHHLQGINNVNDHLFGERLSGPLPSRSTFRISSALGSARGPIASNSTDGSRPAATEGVRTP